MIVDNPFTELMIQARLKGDEAEFERLHEQWVVWNNRYLESLNRVDRLGVVEVQKTIDEVLIENENKRQYEYKETQRI